MTGKTVLLVAHASTALVCLLLGGYQLRRRIRGDLTHRVIGWSWVAGMLFVASSSFAIRELRDGQLSLLHVLSVVTLVSPVLGIVSARRGNIARHRASMRGSWFGLVGAFVGAIAVPERRIPTFTVTDPLGALTAAAAIVVLTVGLIGLAHGLDRWHTRCTRRHAHAHNSVSERGLGWASVPLGTGQTPRTRAAAAGALSAARTGDGRLGRCRTGPEVPIRKGFDLWDRRGGPRSFLKGGAQSRSSPGA